MVDRLLIAKQASWQARANAGQTILVQFSSILANKTWTAADGVTFADLRGRIQQSWLVVRDLSPNVASPELLQAIRTAEPEISGALSDERSAIAAKLLAGEPAGVAGIDYRDRQLVGANNVVIVTQTALANMISRAEEGASRARFQPDPVRPPGAGLAGADDRWPDADAQPSDPAADRDHRRDDALCRS